MAFIAGSNTAITSTGLLVPAPYSTRSSLPSSGVTGYLAYVQDQAEFVVNTNTYPPSSTGPDYNVTWYKFLVKPMDYKNEVILQQGTVGGGYVGASIYNTITRINSVTDVTSEMAQTLSFTTNYGGWASSYQYAYYFQGAGTGANRQDWATHTNISINSQPTGWNSPNSSQPGPKMTNTFAVLMSGTSSQYLTFSTNTWTSGGYNPASSQGYGGGSFGQNYGYTYTYGSNVNYINWSSGSWTQTSSGNHINGGGTYGKPLTSKWNKFYYIGDNTNSTLTVSGFNMATNTWYNTGSPEPNPQSEGSMIMSQDWGYQLGGYGPTGTWTGQNAYSMKLWYATDTIAYNPVSNGLRALSSGSGCWGPV